MRGGLHVLDRCWAVRLVSEILKELCQLARG